MASATTSAQAETLVDAPAPALETIGRKYHSKMRVVDASSDSLSDGVVVPALREAIVEGVLAPGSRLSEVQVAKQLYVSRTPMREAFAQLHKRSSYAAGGQDGGDIEAIWVGRRVKF